MSAHPARREWRAARRRASFAGRRPEFPHGAPRSGAAPSGRSPSIARLRASTRAANMAVSYRTTLLRPRWWRGTQCTPRVVGVWPGVLSGVSLLELRQFQVLSRAIRLRPRADPHLQVPPWLRSTISCSRHVPAGTIGPAGSIRYSPAWIWVVLERPDHSRHDARVFRAPTATTFFLAPVVAALPSPHGAAGAGAAT